MTVGYESERLTERHEGGRRWSALLAPLRWVWRIATLGGFSSLTRRIVLLNLFALGALVTGILVLTQARDSLIDAKVASLTTQGELIANAIAASATNDLARDAPRLEPGLLLDLEAGAGADARFPFAEPIAGLDFPIDPVRAQTILRYVATPDGPRVRIYNAEGGLLLDSDNLMSSTQIVRFNLPPLGEGEPNIFERIWDAITAWFRADIPLYQEYGVTEGKRYPEVATALLGQRNTITRVTEQGELIVSVAVPIRNYQSVQGSLLLTSRAGDIDPIIREERLAILRVFAVAAAVSVVLSLFLAGTIAAPLRRLAEAADSVRKDGVRARPQIPDFSRRRDEIGHLSVTLRDMTAALYNRIEAIESFAADVAHEIKNPLTSLRSAVETLPLAKTPDAQKRLTAIIQHDIRRLDRLITDIADASRLDAELARRGAEALDLAKLLLTLIALAAEAAPEGGPKIELQIFEGAADDYLVMGHDARLGQVFNNLLDNAQSFSPSGTTIRVIARRDGPTIEIRVEDEGPGIRAEQVDRIFERFYTDRPGSESFGQNSGLGLSISKQIVEAHHGQIFAENMTRPSSDGSGVAVAGARFVVRIPAAIP